MSVNSITFNVGSSAVSTTSSNKIKEQTEELLMGNIEQTEKTITSQTKEAQTDSKKTLKYEESNTKGEKISEQASTGGLFGGVLGGVIGLGIAVGSEASFAAACLATGGLGLVCGLIGAGIFWLASVINQNNLELDPAGPVDITQDGYLTQEEWEAFVERQEIDPNEFDKNQDGTLSIKEQNKYLNYIDYTNTQKNEYLPSKNAYNEALAHYKELKENGANEEELSEANSKLLEAEEVYLKNNDLLETKKREYGINE